MKALIIGGTGTISTAVVRRLVQELNWEVYVLNRGTKNHILPDGVKALTADINDEAAVRNVLGDLHFDAVCQFIAYTAADVERDVRLFAGRTEQYLFISSASAYHKPARSYIITEGTTLANPYWQYSRDKIACEEYLMKQYRETGFPVTIVRPSHTYDEKKIPLGLHGHNGSWQVIKRIMEDKPVIIQGDGTSLWTLTFNTDFAVGFTGLMGNPKALGEAFHITGDEALTWNQIYETIASALGKKLQAVHVSSDFLCTAGAKYGYDFTGTLTGDKSSSAVFDNTKLKRAVPDMKTTVRFDQGVRRALQYILAHPEECQKDDPEFDAWCDRVIKVRQEAVENV